MNLAEIHIVDLALLKFHHSLSKLGRATIFDFSSVIAVQLLILAILRYFPVNSVNSFVYSFSSRLQSVLSEMPWSAYFHSDGTPSNHRWPKLPVCMGCSMSKQPKSLLLDFF